MYSEQKESKNVYEILLKQFPVQSMFSSKEIPIDSLKKLIQILGTWYLHDGRIVVKPSACHDYFKKLQQE